MNNILVEKETKKVIERINQLLSTTKPQWGKMSVDKMLAHCNVTYEMTFENIHPKPTGFKKTGGVGPYRRLSPVCGGVGYRPDSLVHRRYSLPHRQARKCGTQPVGL